MRLPLAAAIAGLLGWAGPALAQSVSARLEGVVTDTSGAAVPGASVTATNSATNTSRTATTDGEGNFVLTPLPAGNYVLKVEMPGFKPVQTRVALSVNQVARVDLKIEVGGVTEIVEVAGVTAPIEKTTSTVGTVIDSAQVGNLPLNGRNFTQLATLSPGVNRGVPGGNASGESGNAETFRYGEVGGAAISANGVREQGNSYYYDGIDNNERLVNSVMFFPSPEALQEFKVITANAPAEFGRTGGAVVNLISKSGANQTHGTAYYYGRPESLAATPTFAQEKPEFSRKDFGATLGGPIVKDRTFFFANYHGLKSTLPVEAGGMVTVPTAKMRNGDFSELLNPAFTGIGRAIVINDPLTNAPFPGNVIPANRLNPVGVRYLGVYPLPTRTDRATQNYATNRHRDTTIHDADLRLDHSLGANDQLFLRASYSNADRFDPGRIPGYQAGFGSGTAQAEAYGGAFGYTKTFSSTVINELRLGYNHLDYAFLPVGFGEDQNAAIGIPGPGGITRPNGISLVGGGNGNWIEYLGDFGQYIVTQRNMQISDALTMLRGRHSFKLGGSFLIADLDTERTNVGKGFYFYPDDTAPSAGRTGFEVAEMLVGTTSFTSTGIPGYTPFETRAKEWGLFVQDDLRVSNKLTLNLGVRWDVFTPYYEKSDRLANFIPTFGSNGQINGGQIVLANQGGVSRTTVDTDWNNVGPRVGFAYQLDEKTVLRGSWGIFYASWDRSGPDNQLTENPPYTVTAYRFSGPGSNVRLSDPIPLPPAVDPNDPVLPDGSGVVYVPQDTETNEYQQFNVGIQRELSSNTGLSVAYVGTRGDNLTAQAQLAGFSGSIQGRIRTLANIATSSYDSLQVSLRRNSVDGLSYLASYTWGHALNDSPGAFPGPGGFVTPTVQNDLGVDKGNADFDIRHRFTLAATWLLPWARQDRILGGWSVNAIVTLQTGNWITVFYQGTRPDRVGDPNEGGAGTSDQWFNTSAFAESVTAGQQSGRNIVQGPGLKTIDLSLFKMFKLTDRVGLEFRVEGFNVLNTPQYGTPGQYLDSGDFGRITQTRLNSERQVQLAARLSF
ncbi:MAG: carboxypeptidase regulatory-like domain-containing protein [Vicinamibacteria bacterium]